MFQTIVLRRSESVWEINREVVIYSDAKLDNSEDRNVNNIKIEMCEKEIC